MTKLRPDLQQHLADEEESIAKLCVGISHSDHISNGFVASDHSKKLHGGGGDMLDRDALSSRGAYDRAWKSYASSDRERDALKMHDPRAVFERLGLDRERERDRDHDPLKSLYSVYTADKMQAIFDRDRDLKQPFCRPDNLASSSPAPPSDPSLTQPYGENGQVCRSYADEKHYMPSAYSLNGREPRSRHREHSHPRPPSDLFGSKNQSADSNHPQPPSAASSSASASANRGLSTAMASAAVMGVQGQGAQAAVSVSVTGSDSKPTFQVQSSQGDASGSTTSSSAACTSSTTSSKASYGVQVQVQMPEGKKHTHHMLSVGTEISINVSSAAPSKAPPTTTTTEPSSPSTPQSQASTHTASRPQDREGHIGGGPPHSGNSSHATSSHPGTDQITLRSSAEVSVKVENNRRPLTAP